MYKGMPEEPWGMCRLNSSQPGPSPSNSLNLREAWEVHCGPGSACWSPQDSQAAFPGGLSLTVTWHWARAAVPPGTLGNLPFSVLPLHKTHFFPHSNSMFLRIIFALRGRRCGRTQSLGGHSQGRYRQGVRVCGFISHPYPDGRSQIRSTTLLLSSWLPFS